MFSENPIEISATAGIPGQSYSIIDQVINLENALGVSLFNDEPDVTVSLQTSYDFLEYGSFKIFVNPQPNLEAAVYKDASLDVTIKGHSVSIPIEVTITACAPDFKFAHSKISEEYVVRSGSLVLELPSVTQDPACGLEIGASTADFSFSTFSPELAATAVKLNEDSQSLLVDTADRALIG